MTNIDIIEQNLREQGYIVTRYDEPGVWGMIGLGLSGSYGPAIGVDVTSAKFSPFAFAANHHGGATCSHRLGYKVMPWDCVELFVSLAFDEHCRRLLNRMGEHNGSVLSPIFLHKLETLSWKFPNITDYL
jgi:hypothetical protein